MSKEYYESKNQNIVPTEMLFEMFNKIPNRKEGDPEMGMDEYEQKNLATILEKLNKAEAENQKLREILAMKSENAPDVNSLIQKLMAKDNLAEVELTMSMRMKEYWDK